MKIERRPEWLKKRIGFEEGRATSTLLNECRVNTVCREAKCPNISECFTRGQATFLILGRHCTRRCGFCNVEKLTPEPIDRQEPLRVAKAVEKLKLGHVVITSVTRDDLPDGGASMFAITVEEIRRRNKATIELLIPDFKGDTQAIGRVASSKPDILGHNVETVPRLYHLRPRADYARSLSVLIAAKTTDSDIKTKSALMLGLGEKEDEVISVLKDLRKTGCDFVALGQYLRPSLKHTEVISYVPPEKFDLYRSRGLAMGFKHIESAPYVRSSYLASDYL